MDELVLGMDNSSEQCPSSLSTLAIESVAKIWSHFNDADQLALPHIILSELSKHLSPWKLFTSRHIFRSRNIDVGSQWQQLYKQRWPHLYQQSRDDPFQNNTLGSISLRSNSDYLGSDSIELNVDANMLRYIEKHFQEILRESLSEDFNSKSEIRTRFLISMLSDPPKSVKGGQQMHEWDQNAVSCSLDPYYWLPHITHISVRPSDFEWIFGRKTLGVMSSCIESLRIVLTASKNEVKLMGQLCLIIGYLLQKGRLQKVILIADFLRDDAIWNRLLQLFSGYPCVLDSNEHIEMRTATTLNRKHDSILNSAKGRDQNNTYNTAKGSAVSKTEECSLYDDLHGDQSTSTPRDLIDRIGESNSIEVKEIDTHGHQDDELFDAALSMKRKGECVNVISIISVLQRVGYTLHF